MLYFFLFNINFIYQEAQIIQKINQLQRDGLWSEKRLPKIYEPPRNKAHHDYLLEEMQWLATDFAQERKWKKKAAKQVITFLRYLNKIKLIYLFSIEKVCQDGYEAFS